MCVLDKFTELCPNDIQALSDPHRVGARAHPSYTYLSVAAGEEKTLPARSLRSRLFHAFGPSYAAGFPSGLRSRLVGTGPHFTGYFAHTCP
jgi:hypothetical protein